MDSLLINTEPITITVVSSDGVSMYNAKMGIYTVVRKSDENHVYNLEGKEIGFWFKNALESEFIWVKTNTNFIRGFQIKEMFSAYV